MFKLSDDQFLMISLHGNHISDNDSGSSKNDVSPEIMSDTSFKEPSTELQSTELQSTNLVKKPRNPQPDSKHVENLQTNVLKLSSHLAQVQFRLDQLRLHSGENTVLDKQLNELSEFINTNLSQKEEKSELNYYPVLISDLKKQVSKLEENQAAVKVPNCSKNSSVTEVGSPVDYKIFGYTKNVINRYLEKSSSIGKPSFKGAATGGSGYQSIPMDEGVKNDEFVVNDGFSFPDETDGGPITKKPEMVPKESKSSLCALEEIGNLPFEIRNLKNMESHAILESISCGESTTPLALARLILHGIKQHQLVDPISNWPLLLNIDYKILPLKVQSSVITSFSKGANIAYKIAKAPIDIIPTGSCMKHLFSNPQNSLKHENPQINEQEYLTKAWTCLCHTFSLLNGSELITNPKYTTLLAFKYPVKFPEEISFSREIFKIIKAHQVVNRDASQMFASFALVMMSKRKRMEWFGLIFGKLREAGFYEKWACNVVEKDSVFCKLSVY